MKTAEREEKQPKLEHRSWVGKGTRIGAAWGAGMGAIGGLAAGEGIPGALGGAASGALGFGATGALSGYAYGRGVRSGIKQHEEGRHSPTRRGSVGLAFAPFLGLPVAISHWNGRDRGFAYSKTKGKSEKAASEVTMRFQFVKKANPESRDGDLVSQQTLAGKGGSGPVYKKKPKDGEKAAAASEGNLEGNPGAFSDAFAAFIGQDKGVVTARTAFEPLDNGDLRR